jgi:hypothetical protein
VALGKLFIPYFFPYLPEIPIFSSKLSNALKMVIVEVYLRPSCENAF